MAEEYDVTIHDMDEQKGNRLIGGLAQQDREVQLIVAAEPQLKEKTIAFHIFHQEGIDARQNIQVCKNTTTASL